jgi:hypothetical protein
MGTSKGLPTPRGGGWPRAKRRVNDAMGGSGAAGAGDGDADGNEAADAGGAGDAANAAQGPTANAVAAVVSATHCDRPRLRHGLRSKEHMREDPEAQSFAAVPTPKE